MKDYKYKINGNDYKVSIGDIENNIAQVEVNGVPFNVEIQETKVAPVKVHSVTKPTASTGQATIKSPLPGVIIDIKVNVGDKVTATSVVAILEAMKMENNINAGKDGVVKAICVNKGDSVLEGTDILVIE